MPIAEEVGRPIKEDRYFWQPDKRLELTSVMAFPPDASKEPWSCKEVGARYSKCVMPDVSLTATHKPYFESTSAKYGTPIVQPSELADQPSAVEFAFVICQRRFR